MKAKEKNFASAVIYVHNAEPQIASFLENVIDVMENGFEHSEIICVDDFSDDNSVAKIKEASKKAEASSVSVVHMGEFHGLEMAMNAGVDLAIGDFVFEFDSPVWDFEKDEIMNTYQESISGGYDVVSASPDRKEKFTSSIFYRVFERFANISYHMSTERFRVISRRGINRVSSMNRMVPYRKAVYANCGLKTQNIRYPAVPGNPDYITGKEEKKYRTGLALDSLILFTEVGYRFAVAMTVIMMLMTVFMAAYSLSAYFLFHPVAGWTTTILFLSVVFFGLFGILTVIIRYLQLLVNLVFKRRHYSYEGIEKLTK